MALRSIGTRLTFWYTGILFLTMILLGSVAYGLLKYSLFSDIDIALRGVAKDVAGRIQKEGTTRFPPDLNEIFERFFGYAPANPFFEIWDNLGRQEVYHQPSLPQFPINYQAIHNAVIGKATYYTLKGYSPYPIRVLNHPIMVRGHLTTIVQVGMSLEHMQ